MAINIEFFLRLSRCYFPPVIFFPFSPYLPRFLVFLFFFVACAWVAKPMEPLTNYNVIMVHGAASANNGMGKDEVKANICNTSAYDKYGEVFGAADMMGKNGYANNNERDDYNLTYWLDSAN